MDGCVELCCSSRHSVASVCPYSCPRTCAWPLLLAWAPSAKGGWHHQSFQLHSQLSQSMSFYLIHWRVISCLDLMGPLPWDSPCPQTPGQTYSALNPHCSPGPPWLWSFSVLAGLLSFLHYILTSFLKFEWPLSPLKMLPGMSLIQMKRLRCREAMWFTSGQWKAVTPGSLQPLMPMSILLHWDKPEGGSLVIKWELHRIQSWEEHSFLDTSSAPRTTWSKSWCHTEY